MKKYLLIAVCLLTSLMAFSQPHTLTVSNGYGSGVFNYGDTVNVWSKEYDYTQTFSEWTGETQFLAALLLTFQDLPKEPIL